MQVSDNKVTSRSVTPTTEVSQVKQIAQLQTDIRNLKEGHVFEGEVKDIRRDQVTIELITKQLLIAKLLDNVELTIGQRLNFLIRENTGEQITLKPIHTDKNPLTQDATLIKALQAANLPINSKTIELVKELMKQQMPIDKQSLQRITTQLLANGNADIETIVMMNKHNIAATKENIQQFMNYKNYEHRISNEIESMAKQITEELTNLLDSKDISKAADLNNKLTNIFTSENNSVVSNKFDIEHSLTKAEITKLIDNIEKLNLPEDLKETLKLISKGEHAGSIEKQMQPMNFEEGVPDNKTLASKSELTQSRTDGLPQEMKDLLSKSNLSTGRLMQAINNAIKELVTKDSSEIKQDIKQLLNSTEYKKLMAEHIKNQLFLEPGEVAKENAVAKLYDKLETELKQVRTVLEETTNLDSKLLATTKGLQENIEFMRNLNDVFTYIQIPLKLKNQNASSELYVFTDKEEIKKNKGNISALLHLDLANLGILDIYINKQEKNIQSQFYCDDEVIREALEKNISKLIAPLEGKGYNIYTQIAKREEKVEFVKDFINIGGEQLSLKRYSFDVRA
ncbi:MAG: hypothetical protein K0R15_439 [Clostridiales bacterium]|jgi:hypothetical protein|nr:hypothetical protein [Clostridiales bacterium]